MDEIKVKSVDVEMDKSSEASSTAVETKRGQWGGKLDFLLSCIGYSVGLGTIWRFPYLCYRNGGGAFLIPYVFFLIMFGMPLIILEMGYGQFSSLSPIAVWRMSPLFQGVGYGMVLISGVVCVYYNVIIAWTLYYLVASFTTELPWAHCNNPWNTELCASRWKNINETANSTTNGSLTNIIEYVNTSLTYINETKLKLKTPSEEYWE